MTHITRSDRSLPARDSHIPVAVVLDRLRSAFNVGNIFRIAETTRIQEVITCGYTATPPHPKLQRTARGCDSLVAHRHFATAGGAAVALRNAGYTVYAVETASNAASIWETTLDFPAAFIFGNEALGISEDALRECDSCVALPCLGTKNSLNVGNCAAVILYDVVRRELVEGRSV